MSLENRTKAAAKNVEGKVQETVGDLTGNKKDQVQGNAKQAEAKVRNAAEDVKDAVKKAVD
ncbi:MAG: CsbD family protein [Pseudanabaena frigida]|uniref:CsbD family protein n=1 Tax=Pseudanabaena frigida TaxID=945775 RepID=A0A2W4W0Z8_9CYAN|nr:MAG: CsbD family protein [Pseudanabaena frigida]